jgi:hypothetical protein
MIETGGQFLLPDDVIARRILSTNRWAQAAANSSHQFKTSLGELSQVTAAGVRRIAEENQAVVTSVLRQEPHRVKVSELSYTVTWFSESAAAGYVDFLDRFSRR